jgi:hypothetical protein
MDLAEYRTIGETKGKVGVPNGEDIKCGYEVPGIILLQASYLYTTAFSAVVTFFSCIPSIS